MIISQYLCLHMKTICWGVHIKTPFAFWDMCTWDMWQVCLQTFRNNRIRLKLAFFLKNLQTSRSNNSRIFNRIQMNFFGAAHGWGGKMALSSKICHTYPTMMKVGTVIPYLKKIQKIYESRDTPLEFCWHQHFFTGNQQILLYQEI